MKQIIATFVLLVGFAFSLHANNVKMTIIKQETDSNQVVSTDTLFLDEAQADSLIHAKFEKKIDKKLSRWEKRYGLKPNTLTEIANKAYITAITIFTIFTLPPILLLACILVYRYKNKKAKYELIKQAIEHGKDLPSDCYIEGVIGNSYNNRNVLLRKGIQEFFLGLGITLFLGILINWAISAIGLLIMCIGGGKIAVGYCPAPQEHKNGEKELKDNVSKEAPSQTTEQGNKHSNASQVNENIDNSEAMNKTTIETAEVRNTEKTNFEEIKE